MFEQVGADGRARAGRVTTAHGVIETPIFMPVGTRGTVRTQAFAQLDALDAPVILANTYHMSVRPGRALFETLGGLHRFIGWSRAILTDSGGFQMYSLGDPDLLTPEESIAMQRALGSDIMMVLDRCIDSTSSHGDAKRAIDVTREWALRSKLAARGANDTTNALFGIVQGACYEDLRRESAAAIADIGFDGYAIGGLAVGETRAQREDMTELTAALLPADKPRYLMGVGTPIDLLEAVHRGVDMFDCILPTALAQHGVAFTSHGKLDLRRGVHRLADRPLDDNCRCDACARHSRAFLHHLIKCSEPLAWHLLSNHNLHFYLALVRTMRAHILAGTFARFYGEQRDLLADADRDNPPGRKPATKPRPEATRGVFSLHHGDDFTSIRHAGGEVMHSVNAPDDEARRIYVEQSAAIAEGLAGRDIVVWDVGLGAAHNAMALVRAYEQTSAPGKLALVSFERDLDALHLALANTKYFPHARHPGPHVLAHRGHYTRDGLAWTLVHDDFTRAFPDAPKPDVIFYDPFSAKTDGPMWTLALFEALFEFLGAPVELFTYSASTAVRSSLLAAGFGVARGVGSGPKDETTIAIKGSIARHALLGPAWLDRRARSTAPFSADIPPERHHELELAIRSRPQFRPADPAGD